MIAKLYGRAAVGLVYVLIGLFGIAMLDLGAQEINRHIRCKADEILIPSYERGGDGQLYLAGSVCYGHGTHDRIERFIIDRDGKPVRVSVGKAK